MIDVKVIEITGPYCGTYVEGEKVFNHVAQLLAKGDAVALDFTGVALASSSFFNAIVGPSKAQFGDRLTSRLTFVNLKPQYRFVLSRTLKATGQVA
jgi:hypothetical protein